MSFFAKQRIFYYKKYKIDIWNAFKNTLQSKHDNTIYNIRNGYKKHHKLKKNLKYFNYQNAKIEFQLNLLSNKIKMNQEIESDIIINANTHKILRAKLSRYSALKKIKLALLLSYSNLLNFFKFSITRRFSLLLDSFLEEVVMPPKIFYKSPFIYEARLPVIKKKKRRVNEQFVTFRLIKLFYIMYKHRQLQKIGKKAKLKYGVFEQNYLLILECKLPAYLYRTSFFPTIFDSLEFVKTSNVWVNKQFKPLIFYTVKLFDMVGFRVIYKSYILWHFYKRLRRRAFAFMFSRCIYVSFQFWFTILISRFTLDDLINSFDFDYYRIANYAQ
jgi:hypothetical protein